MTGFEKEEEEMRYRTKITNIRGTLYTPILIHYKSEMRQNRTEGTNVNSEDMFDINEDEIDDAVNKSKNDKVPAKDNLKSELLKKARSPIKALNVLFNKCLDDSHQTKCSQNCLDPQKRK